MAGGAERCFSCRCAGGSLESVWVVYSNMICSLCSHLHDLAALHLHVAKPPSGLRLARCKDLHSSARPWCGTTHIYVCGAERRCYKFALFATSVTAPVEMFQNGLLAAIGSP